MPAGPSCAGSSDPPVRSPARSASRAQRHARIPLGLEPVVAPRSPTPTAGGSTPSEPAPAPGNQPGHQHLDNCRDIVVEASATWLRHGSVAPWGAAGCRPAVFRHRGFDSLPAHHAAVAQPARAAACRAEGHGFESRRWRHVDVAEWRRRRSTKPEGAGSTPAVDAQLAVAQWTRAPPSEGGGRTFESCRRGHALVAQSARARPRYGRGRGCEAHRGPHRGSDPAR